MSTRRIDPTGGRDLPVDQKNLLVNLRVFCHYGIAHEDVPPAVLRSIQSYPQDSQ